MWCDGLSDAFPRPILLLLYNFHIANGNKGAASTTATVGVFSVFLASGKNSVNMCDIW